MALGKAWRGTVGAAGPIGVECSRQGTVQHLSLRRPEGLPQQAGDDAADPGTLIGDPVDVLFAHRLVPDFPIAGEDAVLGVPPGYAGMVERDQFPLVVEDWRAGRSRRRIGLVMEEVGQHITDLVFVQRDLLRISIRMLDDVNALALDHLSQIRVEPHPAEAGAIRSALRDRGDRDNCVIEVTIGGEEGIRVETEADKLLETAPFGRFVIQFEGAVGGFGGGSEDVVVGHHKVRRDQHPGAIACDQPARLAYHDAADAAGDGRPLFEEPGIHQVVGAEDALEECCR